jgi:hypothetical protein
MIILSVASVVVEFGARAATWGQKQAADLSQLALNTRKLYILH